MNLIMALAAASGPSSINWTTILVAALSLIGGGSLAQLFRLRSERTKILSEAKLADANTSQVLSNAATNIIKNLEDYAARRIAELETQINRLTTQYESKIQVLTQQISELNQEIAHLRIERRTHGDDQ